MQINKLLQTVVNQNASDLILTVAAKPMLRLNGRLVPLQTKVLEPDDTVALMKSITSERCQQELQEVGSTDFGFSYGEQARFRVAVFKQRGYTGIVLRLIPNKLLSFEEIGLSEDIKRLLWRPRGLVLVTGPTGSGKTTTLATMIDYINIEPRHAHHHRRGPDRVFPFPQALRGDAARTGRGRARPSPKASGAPCGRTPT